MRKFTFTKDVTPTDWRPFPRAFKKGEEVFEFIGHDYGCARDDAVYGGYETISCSLDGKSNPFFTVPVSMIVDESGNQPRGEYIPVGPPRKF